jgi:hypothetical protein
VRHNEIRTAVSLLWNNVRGAASSTLDNVPIEGV